MSVLDVTESQVLKEDPYFQLQRVVTRGGDEFLVKLAVTDDRGNEEKLLEREFALFQAIGASYGLSSVRLARLGGRLAAVYEAFDGAPLAPRGLALAEFSELIGDLCAILAALHGRGTMLLGVSPSSFLRSARSRRVVLADAPFAQADGSAVDRSEEYWLESPYLAYAAPEVVGGGSLPLDHRADLYSLGGVLYHLISRRPLFNAVDPAEIIQCHLAREPKHLRELVPALPAGLSDAVMKLLAKNPRERFATVEAFEQAIAEHLSGERERARGPRARTSPAAIAFSTQLYGNRAALELVRERVRTARTEPAIAFIVGDAGIGKTTLLREVQQLEAHACFARGEFTRPAKPLGGWTSALIDLANVVLTSRTVELEVRRARILEQLGEWAPLIAALAPEWQTILRCPEATHDPLDSLNRLALAIRRLIGCYADDDSPIVVVLDDLQWADASSLRILELILTEPEPLSLLVLAAVRDGGEDGAAVVHELRDRLRPSVSQLDTVQLAAWTARDIAEFAADSLENDIADADELAERILAKTHGNPFFVRELLRAMVEHGALRSLAADRPWQWDEQALRRLPVTDNVVGLLSQRIAGLPADVKDALRICACLGRTFNLGDFCLVSEKPPSAGSVALERATAEGLVQRDGPRFVGVVRVETTYEFVHDRVLEAARALLSDDGAATHLRIGRMLSRKLGVEDDEERIYRVASHFQIARHLVDDREERYSAAELSLKAGRLARLRGAFSQALEFLEAGLAFLADGGSHEVAWRERAALTRLLHEETAWVALLDGQLSAMTRLCDAILAHARLPMQKVLAYELRIRGLKVEKRFSEAVDAALVILRELGVEFPRRPTVVHLALAFRATRRRVFAGPVPRLVDLPAMQDSRIKAVGRIIDSVYSAAYLARPEMFPFLVFRHVNDSLRYGNEDYSCMTYTAFGVVLGTTGRFEAAQQLGMVGLDLLRQGNSDRLKARVFVAYYTFISPWLNHVRESLPYYREAVDCGLVHGDFEYASYALTLDSLARLHTGDSLSDLDLLLERRSAKVESLGYERTQLLQRILCQTVYALRHGTEQANLRSGRHYRESHELPRLLEPLDDNLAFHNHLAKLTLCVLHGDHATAAEAARRGRPHLRAGGFAIYLAAVFRTYDSLACLIAGGRTRATMRHVRRNQRKLAAWAKTAPMNFLHRYHLVEAERCRVLGLGERAAEHFEKAIELAQEHGYVHEAGLAQERAAIFYFSRGMERLGRQFLRDCYVSYRKWGAEALIRRLERDYAQHLAILSTGADGPIRRSVPRFSETLDYRTLLKSSQAISGEVRLPRLLERLLQNILQHSGAQRAILVLETRGVLCVEAEANVDESGVRLVAHEPVEDSDRLCRAIVHYSARMSAPVLLADAAHEGLFMHDPYVRAHRPKSVLCAPVHYSGKLVGLVYLENHRVSHVFTEARLEIVNLLAAQAAISIANARFHALQLEAQQAKINPHFLFNALSSIADLAVSDGSKAETAIVKLASLYRYILTNSMGELVGLEQELEIVRNYLTLEKLRFGAQLAYSVTSEGDVTQVRLPGLLIQPLVENSIRHGVAPKLTRGTVSVHAAVRGGRCHIVVQDDGDGANHATAGTGFGLRSIQERLALAYGQRFSFAISRTAGYRVEIEIPAVAG